MRSDLRKEIKTANLSRYGGGEIVATYLSEKYNRLRLQRVLEIIRAFCPLGTVEKHVLEVGAGSTTLSNLLQNAGYRVTVSDADVSSLHADQCGSLEILQLDVTQQWPTFPKPFDVIVAAELIEHLFDPVEFLQRCHSALAADGLLIITTPNLATLQDRLRFLLGRSPRQINPIHPYLRLHIRPFTRALLADCLRHTRFRVLQMSTNCIIWRTPRRSFMSERLGKIFPGFGGSIIAVARAQRD